MVSVCDDFGCIVYSGTTTAAYTIQQFGVTVGAVMQKMSIIMSVAWTLVFYNETAGWMKVIDSIAQYWLFYSPINLRKKRWRELNTNPIGYTSSFPHFGDKWIY
ncbi:MAG: hypothetical protein R2784_15315 [Saprospiraceae bacterium]